MIFTKKMQIIFTWQVQYFPRLAQVLLLSFEEAQNTFMCLLKELQQKIAAESPRDIIFEILKD